MISQSAAIVWSISPRKSAKKDLCALHMAGHRCGAIVFVLEAMYDDPTSMAPINDLDGLCCKDLEIYLELEQLIDVQPMDLTYDECEAIEVVRNCDPLKEQLHANAGHREVLKTLCLYIMGRQTLHANFESS